MTFADLATGDAVFVDANTFIYHFSPDPVLGTPCSQLLQRIEKRDLVGYTSTQVLAEVAHKMMTVEANRALGWPFSGMPNRLRRHPAEVRQLSVYGTCIRDIAQSQVRVLPLPLTVVESATAVCQQSGLLTNDALIVATMHHHSFTRLASHDTDFDRVPGITRYGPA